MNAADDAGTLVLVATPIGNLGDMAPDALAIRAENEVKAVEPVTAWLGAGRQVALVSDAGIPALADPGERLVRGVLDAGGRVRVVAGPDAATTALLVSGLSRHRWCFEGFLPRIGARRTERLASLAEQACTTVVYEAPHRLHRTLVDLDDRIGSDRAIAVCNDLTKRYEQVWRGTVRSVRAALQEMTPRGEFVLVIGGAERSGDRGEDEGADGEYSRRPRGDDRRDVRERSSPAG